MIKRLSHFRLSRQSCIPALRAGGLIAISLVLALTCQARSAEPTAPTPGPITTDTAASVSAAGKTAKSINTPKAKKGKSPHVVSGSAGGLKTSAEAAEQEVRQSAMPMPTAASPSVAASSPADSLLAPDPLYPEGISSPPPLPADMPPDHNANKTMTISPTRVGPLIQIASLHPVRLDATYNAPLSLREALLYATIHNLPIKISRESWNFQRYQFYSNLGNFLPTASGSYSYTHSNVFHNNTVANTRVWSGTLRQGFFSGGSVFYGALAQYYRQKGWRSSYGATINDTLLGVYQNYNNLLLQRALLQIRAKSVETSEAQLKLNTQLYNAGTGTRFAVMQSRTQLASDRQALLQQQVNLRQAGLNLAFALNLPMAVNLVPAEDVVTEAALFDEGISINDLINQALVNRPELRQYEYFRLAAARNVQSASSSLYPNVSGFVTLSHNSTTTNGGSANNLVGSGVGNAQNTGVVSSGGISTTSLNNALGQTPGFSATGSTTGNTGASTTATTVAGGGGSPNATVQSGGLVTSGGVSPAFNSANVAASGGGAGGFGGGGGITNSLQVGLNATWTLGGLGVPAAMNIMAARCLARQALFQANQELLLVTQQVRTDYLNALTAREQIDVAASGVASSGEALRLANLRVQTGVGTNLELITAQRDYISALISQVQAIIGSNQAQAQLLHDTGMISIDTLTRGSNPRIGLMPSTL